MQSVAEQSKIFLLIGPQHLCNLKLTVESNAYPVRLSDLLQIIRDAVKMIAYATSLPIIGLPIFPAY